MATYGQQIAQKYGIPEPQGVGQFTQYLPFDKIYNPSLFRGVAESLINPEEERKLFRERMGMDRYLGQSGAFRTGAGQRQMTDLMDAGERRRQERVQSFLQPIQGTMSNYYTQMMENYYKNPASMRLTDNSLLK